MESLPLHPAIVHLPIGIALMLPILNILFFWLFKTGKAKREASMILIIMHLGLATTSFLAMQLGEIEEEKIEHQIDHNALENHEHKGEFYAQATIALALVSVLLVFTRGRRFEQVLGLLFIGQIILIFFTYQVGHSGAQLVYKHDAATLRKNIAERREKF